MFIFGILQFAIKKSLDLGITLLSIDSDTITFFLLMAIMMKFPLTCLYIHIERRMKNF